MASPADPDADDPLLRALRTLPPIGRSALRRALLTGLGRSVESDSLAADTINTEAEPVPVADASRRLSDLVARAAHEGARAPLVRLDQADGSSALLASSEHLWSLVDRVDELEVSLRILAVASIRELGAERLEALLAELGA
ncbi:MAG: hypothetical protein WKF96_01115 [Solirubrobacteraceae bacterium]